MMRTTSGIFCALTGAMLFVVACSFGGSQGNPPMPDSSTTSGAHCGDGVCSPSEVNSCPQDCGGGSNNNANAVCGNGVCETSKGETAQSCPSDCAGSGSNTGSNGSGNGMCPADPTDCLNCILGQGTCPNGLDMNGCVQCLIGGLGSGGSGSGACNFNFMCDPGEDANSCPTDCM